MKKFNTYLLIIMILGSVLPQNDLIGIRPKRWVQCVFMPKKHSCTSSEKTQAHKWLLRASVAVIAAVATAIGIKTTKGQIQNIKQEIEEKSKEQAEQIRAQHELAQTEAASKKEQDEKIREVFQELQAGRDQTEDAILNNIESLRTTYKLDLNKLRDPTTNRYSLIGVYLQGFRENPDWFFVEKLRYTLHIEPTRADKEYVLALPDEVIRKMPLEIFQP